MIVSLCLFFLLSCTLCRVEHWHDNSPTLVELNTYDLTKSKIPTYIKKEKKKRYKTSVHVLPTVKMRPKRCHTLSGRNVIIPNDMTFYHLGEICNYPSQKKYKILMIHNSSDSR